VAQNDFGNQLRINNQLIANKNEPRSKSNLKPQQYGGGQNFSEQVNHMLVGQHNNRNNNANAQFNNYLSQQNYFDGGKQNGQSPLLKKNPAAHKKSESVAQQRPPDQIHGQMMKGNHSSSIEPNPTGHKSTYSAMSQLNNINAQVLSNITNPNVNLYQKYNNYKANNK